MQVSAKKAGSILKAGGIIAYPTETFYGLGVSADNTKAIERLFEVKQRDKGKPISILIANADQVFHWAKDIGKLEQTLMDHFWPGPLTIVFWAKKNVSQLLTAGTGKIGIRFSPKKESIQ